MTANATTALEGRRRKKRLVGQLWFWVLIAIDRIMSEGHALTNAIGNSVATMVIAGWQGERDDERFQCVLANPELVDEEVARALRGESGDQEADEQPRFERDGESRVELPAGVSGSGSGAPH